MKCPKCNIQLTRGMGRVTQVRHSGEKSISRQRKCDNCGHVWATAEIIVPDDQWTYIDTMRSNGSSRPQFTVKGKMLERLQAA